MELPAEILEVIFEFLTKESQCISQYVCRAWHLPAKRIFYNTVDLSFNSRDLTQQDRFKRLIHSLGSPISFNASSGQCLRHLRVDFQIALEPTFMPTTTDFQSLASYCPNLKSFLFPGKMFWKTMLETAHSFSSLQMLPALDFTHENYEQLLHFRHSLNTLEIASWQDDLTSLADYIAMFTKIQTLIITCKRFTSLHDAIPILFRCSTLRHLILHLTFPMRTKTVEHMLPGLTHLTLTLSKVCPDTLSFIYKNLPDLQSLSLKFTSEVATATWSDEQIHVMQELLSFSETLYFASIHVFTGVYELTHDLAQVFTKTSYSLVVRYDSRVSTTSLIPDFIFEKKNKEKQLCITYQGIFSDLPHGHFLTRWGENAAYLQVTYPSATRNQRKSDINLIIDYCPYLRHLVLNRAYLNPISKCSHEFLTSFTLKQCLLETDYISSFTLPSLQKLKFKQCEYVEEQENLILLDITSHPLQPFPSV